MQYNESIQGSHEQGQATSQDARPAKAGDATAGGGTVMRAGARDAGGFHSNTPPSTSHVVNEDTIHLGLLVQFDPEHFAALRAEFDACRDAADRDDGDDDPMDWSLYRGGRRFTFSPKGAKAGDGGPVYRWRFQCDGFTFLVMNRHEPSGETPNMRVQVGSQVLMSMGGAEPVHQVVTEVVESFGGTITGEKLGRIDVAADLAGIGVRDFVDLYHRERYVTRLRKQSEYAVECHKSGRRYTGVSFGTGMRLRIYDKPFELRRDPIKAATWRAMWDEPPEVCTRVEFQVNREALKSFGINSMADYLAKRAALVEYLTEQWFRFTASDVDRTHTSRAKDHPLWEKVKAAFRSSLGKATKPIQRFTRKVIHPEALEKQVRGCVEQIAAIKGHYTHSTEQLIDLAKYIINNACSDDEPDGSDLRRRIKRKRFKLEASVYCPYE